MIPRASRGGGPRRERDRAGARGLPLADGRGRRPGSADWLSTLAPTITFRRLVDAARLRRRIERDYQEPKQERGLGHYEGRGFHHQATLCIAACGFLVSERETIPPSGRRRAALFPQATLPDSYRPRGVAAAA